ncbi:MAG: iron-containing redox enzyme family protein [Oligoflexus sp.]|nr:iron-containing redox enzyme family protein [Oligoflexus sp.]
MLIAERVKKQTEVYANFLEKEEPFNIQMNSGVLSAESYANFLFNIEYLIKHTPIHLNLALKKTEDNPELHEYFRNKFDEEQGHDEWAIEDRKKVMKKIDSVTFFPQVSLEMWRYVRELEAVIDRDPRLYLTYIFYTEYLTVLVANRMKIGLVKCGFGDDPVEVLTKHAELDVHHTAEGMEAIKTFLPQTEEFSQKVTNQLKTFVELHILMWKACVS